MISTQLQEFLEMKLSTNTKKNYQHILTRFLEWTLGGLPEDKYWVNLYETNLKQAGLVNKTINLHMTVIKQFYQYLGKSFTHKRLKESPTQIHFLSPSETQILLANAEGSFKGVLMFMFDTGVRVSELANISQVKHEQIKKEWIILGKGDKQRVVVIGDKTRQELKKLSKDGYLFGKPWSVRMVQYHIKNLAREAGIKKNVHPHLTRHGFSINMLESGASLPEVKEMLGHSSIATTMLYTHVSKERLVQTWGNIINK